MDSGHPERAFLQKSETLGLGRQIGLKFYEAFGGISFLQKTFRSKTYNTQMLPN